MANFCSVISFPAVVTTTTAILTDSSNSTGPTNQNLCTCLSVKPAN